MVSKQTIASSDRTTHKENKIISFAFFWFLYNLLGFFKVYNKKNLNSYKKAPGKNWINTKGSLAGPKQGRAQAGGAGRIPSAPIAGGEGLGGEKIEELKPHL